MDLKIGDEIAVARLESVDSIAAFSDYSQASQEFSSRNISNKVVDNGNNFIYRQQMRSQENNSALLGSRVEQDISEIRIPGDKDQGFFADEFVDFLIRGSGFNIADIPNLMAGLFEGVSDRAGAVSVNKEFHSLGGNFADQFLFVSQQGSIEDTGAHSFSGNRPEFFFDLINAHSRGQCFQDNINRSARPFNAGPALLNLGVHSDISFHNFFITHFISSSFVHLPKAYYILKNLSSQFVPLAEAAEFSSTFLSRAKPRDDLRLSTSDILWVKIASIDYVGYEQVYDIEVEGTHNFVAGHWIKKQVEGGRWKVEGKAMPSTFDLRPSTSHFFGGIIAHNTYIQSNTGIGATAPAAKLHILSSGSGTGFTLRTQDTAGIDKLVVLDNGNVGVGTTNPAYKMQVAGSFDATAITVNGSPLTASVAFNTITSGTNTTATMTVGAGGALDYVSTGAINAKTLVGSTWLAPGIIGGTTATSGSFTALASTQATNLATATGNIGLGTASPIALLQAGSGPTSSLVMTSIGNVGIGNTAPLGRLHISEAGSYVSAPTLFLTAAGNVGIGTTRPGQLLSLKSTTAGKAVLNIWDASSASNAEPVLEFGISDANGFVTSNAARIWAEAIGGDEVSLHFSTYNSAAPTTPKVTINNAGNLGIGTTNPSDLLEVGASGKKSFEVRPDANYVSLLVDGVEVARLRN